MTDTTSGGRDAAGNPTYPGYYYAFQGSPPNLEGAAGFAPLLTSFNSTTDGLGQDMGGGEHFAASGVSVTFQGTTYYGADDLMNPYYDTSQRRVVSRSDAYILASAYGYTVADPASALGTFYAAVDPSTGNLLIRGGNTDFFNPDTITISREGTDTGTLVVSLNLGHPTPAANLSNPLTLRINQEVVHSITVQPANGNDTLVLDFSGGNFIPSGGLSYNGGGSHNGLVLKNGSFNSETYSDFPRNNSINLDGSTITYTNVEFIQDTTSASNLTFGRGVQNPREIDVLDGGYVSGVPVTQISGGGAFTPVSFANKVNVQVNGYGGNTLVLNNPTAAAGLVSLDLNEINTSTRSNTFRVLNTPQGVNTYLDCSANGDTVNVQGTSGPLFINGNVGTGPFAFLTAVTIGSQAPNLGGTLANVRGTVTVSGAAHSTSLVVDDQGDATSHYGVTLGAGALRGLTPAGAEIDYYATALTSLDVYGSNRGNTFTVTDTPNNPGGVTTTLHDGAGGDTVNVRGTSGALNVIGNGTFFRGALLFGTAVNVGSQAPNLGGTLANVRGAVNVSGAAGSTALTVDDSGEPSPATRHEWLANDPVRGLSAGRITGLAPAAIAYDYAATSSLTLQTGGETYVHVLATGVPTMLVNHGRHAADILGDAGFGGDAGYGAGADMQAIIAPVYISNPDYWTDYNNVSYVAMDDTPDATYRSAVTVDGVMIGGTQYDRVTGLAPAPVYYVAGPVWTDLRTGVGGATVNVSRLDQLMVLRPGAPHTRVNVSGGWNDLTINTFNGGRGTVAITVDDSADATFRTATLNTVPARAVYASWPDGPDVPYGRITGLGLANINSVVAQ